MSGPIDRSRTGEIRAQRETVYRALSRLPQSADGMKKVHMLATAIQKKSGAPRVQQDVVERVSTFLPTSSKTLIESLSDAVAFGIVSRGMSSAIEQGQENTTLKRLGLTPGGALVGRDLEEIVGFYMADAIVESQFRIHPEEFLPAQVSQAQLHAVGRKFVQQHIPNLSLVVGNLVEALPVEVQKLCEQDIRYRDAMEDAFLLAFIRAGNPYEMVGGSSTSPYGGPDLPPFNPTEGGRGGDLTGSREPRRPRPGSGQGGAEAQIPTPKHEEEEDQPTRRILVPSR